MQNNACRRTQEGNTVKSRDSTRCCKFRNIFPTYATDLRIGKAREKSRNESEDLPFQQKLTPRGTTGWLFIRLSTSTDSEIQPRPALTLKINHLNPQKQTE